MFSHSVKLESDCFSLSGTNDNYPPQINAPMSWEITRCLPAVLYGTGPYNSFDFMLLFRFCKKAFGQYDNDLLKRKHYRLNCRVFCAMIDFRAQKQATGVRARSEQRK